jgi:hypothetical protein
MMEYEHRETFKSLCLVIPYAENHGLTNYDARPIFGIPSGAAEWIPENRAARK